jgi:hypothetical protein
MNLRLSLLLIVLLAAGCSPSAHRSLKDVEPTRVYPASVNDVFETARLFGIAEGYKIERFEQGSGKIIGYKRADLQMSRGNVPGGRDPSRLVIMNLTVRPLAQNQTEVNASFSFGGTQPVVTRDEEDQLLDCYYIFFDYMQKHLPH